MNERSIQKVIKSYRKYSQCLIPNIYWNTIWESDLLEITKDDRIIEYEIKTSVTDFKADFGKVEKHNMLNIAHDLTLVPNYFVYVCQEGIIDVDNLPNYAGLYHVVNKGLSKYIKVARKPPMIHNEPIEPSKWKEIAMKLIQRL